MSGFGSAAQATLDTTKSIASRLLVAAGKKNKVKPPIAAPEAFREAPVEKVEFTVLSFDYASIVSKTLFGVDQGAAPLMVTADIELTGKSAKFFASDPSFMQTATDCAKRNTDRVVFEGLGEIANLSDAEKVDWMKNGADRFFARVSASLESYIQEGIVEQIRQFEKSNADAKLLRAKTRVKIVMGVANVVAQSVAVGLTWGATSPVAVIAIARSCVTIAQSIAHLTADADHHAAILRGYFVVLDQLIVASKSNDVKQKLRQKYKNDAKMVGIGAIAGITNLELPTVDNCEKALKWYESNVSDIVQQNHALNAHIGPLGDYSAVLQSEIEKLEKLVATNKGGKLMGEDLNEVLNKHQQLLDLVSPAFNQLLETVTELTEKIAVGMKNRIEWTAKVEEYRKLTDEWVDNVATVFAFTTDLGLGLGASVAPLDFVMAALGSSASALTDWIMDKV